MALVLFSYANPFVDQLQLEERIFTIDGQLLRIEQAWRGDGKGGTDIGFGASVYPAAYVLAEYLERHPDLVRGKRVIELGTGTGFLGIAAAVLGASSVCLTDGDDGSLRLAERNVSANLPPVHQQHSRAPRDRLETEKSEMTTANQASISCCKGGANVETTTSNHSSIACRKGSGNVETMTTNRSSMSFREGSGTGNVTTDASAGGHHGCGVLQVGDAAAACSVSEGRCGRVGSEGAAAAPDTSPRMVKPYPPAGNLVGVGGIKDLGAPGAGALDAGALDAGALGAGYPNVDARTPTASAASGATMGDGSSVRVGVHYSDGGGGGGDIGGGGDGGGGGGPDADDLCQLHQRQKRPPRVSVRKLRWGFPDDMEACLGEGGGYWEVVIGSDIAALPYASAHGDLVRTIAFLVNGGSAAALVSGSAAGYSTENGAELNAENATEVSGENATELSTKKGSELVGENGAEINAENATELEGEGENAAEGCSPHTCRGDGGGGGGGGEGPGEQNVKFDADAGAGDESGTGLLSLPLAPLTTLVSPRSPPPPPPPLPPRQLSSPPVTLEDDRRGEGGEGRKVLVLLAHKRRHVCEEAFFEDLRAELGESSSCLEMGEDDVHPDFRGMGIHLLAFEVDVCRRISAHVA